mmetsp:Transcript_29013/g.81488  ORF Transcript_29013/g.81488 Transcript_29013/m.81488 type:complete len:143 (-) Transcript_29013:223-651(-)
MNWCRPRARSVVSLGESDGNEESVYAVPGTHQHPMSEASLVGFCPSSAGQVSEHSTAPQLGEGASLLSDRELEASEAPGQVTALVSGGATSGRNAGASSVVHETSDGSSSDDHSSSAQLSSGAAGSRRAGGGGSGIPGAANA